MTFENFKGVRLIEIGGMLTLTTFHMSDRTGHTTKLSIVRDDRSDWFAFEGRSPIISHDR
jgi:hypothetical protein